MNDIPAFILCGGQSRRMGRNKSFLEWKGRSFLEWSLEAVRPIARRVALVTTDPAYLKFDLPLIHDHFPGKGPASGIHAALVASDHPYCLILSCDCPAITPELLIYLGGHHSDEGDVTYIRKQNKVYPLIGIYRKSLEGHFEKNLISGNQKLMKIIESYRCVEVEIPRVFYDQVQNINTPDEFVDLKTMERGFL